MVVFLFIFLLLMVAYAFLIGYYMKWWNRIPLYKSSAPNTGSQEGLTQVSIIVAVRNEETNIENLISHLVFQDYPKQTLQVTIVDDHSTDNTWSLLSNAPIQHSNIRILHLPESLSGKKDAIEYAISQSTGELIVATDADCKPSQTWISTVENFYRSRKAKFVVSPVKMTSKNSISGIFQRLDFLTLQGITAASVFSGFHSMCNGANLAYEKQAFHEVNGFDGIDNIPSGDDMLLMHKIQQRYPRDVFYLKNKDAIVLTAAEPGWRSFFQQRIRWSSKAVHYDDRRMYYALLLTYLVNVCFLALTIISFIDGFWTWLLLSFLLMKILIEFPFVNAVSEFFGERKLMLFFPFMQPIHIAYVLISGWLGRFGSYSWKSRIVKNKGRTKSLKH